MTNDEIANLLFKLLGATAAYCGVKFGCDGLDPAARILFARGLIAGLIEPERYLLEMEFERIRTEIAASRMVVAVPTHASPALVQ